MNQSFELPGSYKKWTMGLLIVGAVALLYGFIMYHPFDHAGHGVNLSGPVFGLCYCKTVYIGYWW